MIPQVTSLMSHVFYCRGKYDTHYYIRVLGSAINDKGETVRGFLEVSVPDLNNVFENLPDIRRNVASYVQEIIDHPDWFFTTTDSFPVSRVSNEDLIFTSNLSGPSKDGLYDIALFDRREPTTLVKSDRSSLDGYPYFIFSDFDQSRMESPILRDPKLPPRVIIS